MGKEDKKKNKPKSKPASEELETTIDEAVEADETCECECDDDHECHCAEHGCKCHEESKEAVYLEALQRTMAEFDNYRKRMATATERAKADGVCQAITSILPSVDALDNAIKMLGDNEQVVSGLKLVKENILNSFKNLGLEEIDALNKPFDPELHNAVSAGEVEGVEEGIVVEEYQKGYKLGDRVVRYTMCRVSK